MRTLPQMARPSQAERIKAARDAARELDLAKQRVTVRCAHCSGRGNGSRRGRPFQFTGPIREAHERFAVHRAEAHPELTPLDKLQTSQKRTQRRAVGGKMSAPREGNYAKREFQTAEELREREALRRLTRSDLASIDEEAA
jgi:hypothetical protein